MEIVDKICIIGFSFQSTTFEAVLFISFDVVFFVLKAINEMFSCSSQQANNHLLSLTFSFNEKKSPMRIGAIKSTVSHK